jgi:DNA-binding MarR family transcriptional regulator
LLPSTPGHRRRNSTELTPKARWTLARVRQAFAECDAEFLAPLSKTERQQLANLLAKISPPA